MTTVSGTLTAEGASAVLRIGATPEDVTYNFSSGSPCGRLWIEENDGDGTAWAPFIGSFANSVGSAGSFRAKPKKNYRFRLKHVPTVTNGTFASDTGWTKGTGWTIAAGVATQGGTGPSSLSQTPATWQLHAGISYDIKYDLTASAGTMTVKVGGTSGTGQTSTAANKTETIIAGTGGLLEFTGDATFAGTIDNVSIVPSVVYTMSDTDAIVLALKDADGNTLGVDTQAGRTISGTLAVTGATTITGALTQKAAPVTTFGNGTLPAITGASVVENGDGVLHQTVITLAAVSCPVTDALAYAGLELYDFPEGRILVLGATGSIQWAVTTDRSTTINDNASLTWSLGTVTASNVALTSTMVDLLPLATKVLAAATTALNTASNIPLAVAAQFDGTATAKKAFLNTAFATNTDIDADGTLTATGTITITWMSLGDY